jgi:homotetrameric cytidine deaminase
LRDRAREYAGRSHTPFSDEPTAAVVLLDDGSWVPGVRVESASFSLTLPALLNAYSTVVAADRASDVLAFVLSRPFRREEALYVEELPHGPFDACAADAWIRSPGGDGALPSVGEPLSPYVSETITTETDGLRAARSIAEGAYVPSSNYPVGALAETDTGRLVPGVNVEHPDWTRILCAERNALGTTLSYATGRIRRLFLSCLEDEEGTPCGACRQLLAERAPESTLWMDRHEQSAEQARISSLLPGSFRGQALLGTDE